MAEQKQGPEAMGAAIQDAGVMIAPLDLDELELLADVATEGPWNHKNYQLGRDVHDTPCVLDGRASICDIHDSPWRSFEDRENDARFIAAARTAVPALIAELREARAERDASDSAFRKLETQVADSCFNAELRHDESQRRIKNRARLEAERDAALAAIDRVRAEHQEDWSDWQEGDDAPSCTCGGNFAWHECPTVRALEVSKP